MTKREIILAGIMGWITRILVCHMIYECVQTFWLGKVAIFFVVDYLIGVLTRIMIFRMNLKDALSLRMKKKKI